MNKQVFVLYFNIFLIFLDIGSVIPVLPVYLEDSGLTGNDLGLLVAVFALSQMIMSPFGGMLADKLGKKLIICMGLILFSVSKLVFAVSHNFSVLVLSRMIGGMSADMVMLGVTGLIAGISPGHQKAKNSGYMLAIISSGFILRPGIGGLVTEVSHRIPFYFTGTLGILAFIMSIVLIHDPEKSTTSGFRELEPQLLTKISWKVFITPVILALILSFGLSVFETLYSLYTADKVNYSPKDISVTITGSGILGALF